MSFKSPEFAHLIENVGTIFVGAGVVVKLAGSLAAKFGWPFVKSSTNADSLLHLFEKSAGKEKCRFEHNRGSFSLCAALILGILGLSAGIVAPKLAIDGYASVEYSIIVALTFSSTFAIVLRYRNPFTWHSILYTETLFLEGQETFVDGDGHPHKLDLYEWIHLPHEIRQKHLLHYARRISNEQVEGGTFTTTSVVAIKSHDGYHARDVSVELEPVPTTSWHHVNVAPRMTGKVLGPSKCRTKVMVEWKMPDNNDNNNNKGVFDVATDPQYLMEDDECWIKVHKYVEEDLRNLEVRLAKDEEGQKKAPATHAYLLT